MNANQAFFAIATMARALDVSTAGYFARILAVIAVSGVDVVCPLRASRGFRHAPSPMRHYSDECARSMLSGAASTVYLEFMPSCAPKVGQSAGSGLAG